VITFWIPACLIPVHASLRTLYSTPGRSSIGSADPDLDPIPRHTGAQCIIQSELWRRCELDGESGLHLP